MEIEKLHPLFVAQVTGVDLSRALDPASRAALSQAFDEHSVLIFPEQRINDAQQIAFSENFGELEIMQKGALGAATVLAGISNVDPQTDQVLDQDDPRMLRQFSNEIWHTDSSFKATSARASALHAREIPPSGGATHFASMRAAWDALDPQMQTHCEQLAVQHSFEYSRSLTIDQDFLSQEQKNEVPPVPQALVNMQPRTGRKSLYLASHAKEIIGWPFEVGRAFLDELTVHATQPQFTYTHQWRQWDLVMWDNRATMHKGSRYEHARHRRVMVRTTVAGDAPTITEADLERAKAYAQSQIRDHQPMQWINERRLTK